MNNKIKTSRRLLIRTVFFITLIFAGTIQLVAQQDKFAYFEINRFWGGVSEQGSKTNFGFNINLFADYSVYASRLQRNDTQFGGYITVATTNWTDNAGKTIPFAVFTPTNSYMMNGKVIKALENYVRYINPLFTVENTNIAPNVTNLGTVDPAKCIGTSDQSITVTNEYACGVQVERKIIGWSQQYHDNYVVNDLTFTNVSGKTLTGFYIAFQEGISDVLTADGLNPTISDVDAYTPGQGMEKPRWWNYYGANKSDSLRVYYSYSADDNQKTGDQMGQPISQQYGRLLDKDFNFTAAVHASLVPYTPTPGYTGAIDPNDIDDRSQPKVAQVANISNVLSLPVYPLLNPDHQSLYDFISGQRLASEDMSGPDIWPGGHYRKNLDDMNLVTAGGQPGIHTAANNYESMNLSFGPYQFENGKQIRIIKVSGWAGLSREKALEIGKKYLAKTLQDPPINYLPPNFKFPTTDAQDIAKDKWFATGIDSVLKTVSRAKYNFKTGWKVPVTPPPPTSTTVLGTGEGVEINWSGTAENLPNFQGYRLMKKISLSDTTFYQEVTRTSPTDKAATHKYVDTNLLFGAQYYYYIQAGIKIANGDPNAHPSERGKTIWSGRIWYPTNTSTQPKRKSQNDLTQIAMVPNPYNYNDPLLRGYGDVGYRGIRFYNLPITVTIKIFTENGDLVTTIEHDKPITKDGFEVWNMTNDSQTPVASGIYVVLFQTPDGKLSYQKLVVAH